MQTFSWGHFVSEEVGTSQVALLPPAPRFLSGLLGSGWQGPPGKVLPAELQGGLAGLEGLWEASRRLLRQGSGTSEEGQ